MSDAFAAAFLDTIKRPEIDVFGILGYEPTEKQRLFHELSRKRVDAILYGGARGGGKSVAMTLDAIWHAVNYPGMKILCLRRTYGELDESFFNVLRKYKYADALGAKWNQTNFKLSFPNGSIINFSYAETVLDAERVLGGEYQEICVDEATRTIPEIIEHVSENLRSGDRTIPVIGLRCATNPGGIGANYMKKRFIHNTQTLGKIEGTDDKGQSVAYIKALMTDNPYLDSGYKARLEAITDPARRAAMLEGDWDALVGQFFHQWRYDRHVVPAFEIPEGWQRYAGIDYGIVNWAVVWGAVDQDGRVYIHREIYAGDIDATTQAQYILDVERKHNDPSVYRYADPSMWGRQATLISVADMYGQAGCGIMKADNDRLNGWSRVHQFLNDGPACQYHRSLGWDTCPMLHVFEGACPEFCRTVADLPRATNNPDDAETKNVEDHIPDALRYMIGAVGATASPVLYGTQSTPSIGPVQKISTEERVKMVSGRFAGDLGMGAIDSY